MYLGGALCGDGHIREREREREREGERERDTAKNTSRSERVESS